MLQRLKLNKQTIKIGNRTIKLLPKEDRALFFICVGIALVFWLLVKLSRTYTSAKTVIFHYEIPEGKTFAAYPPQRLEVRIEGRGWELLFDYLLNPRIDLHYHLADRDQLELSQEELSERIEQQMAFNSIQIIESSYPDITLRLEDGLSKTIPLILEDSLQFLPGYVLQEPVQLQPDSIRVSGPNSLVNSISVWRTNPFVLKDLKSNVSQSVTLAPPPPEIRLSTQSAKVLVKVEQVTEKALFIPLQVRNAPDSVKYFPEKVKVTCTVGLSAYNIIDTSNFTVEIDLKKVPLSEGKHTLPIQLTKKPKEALSVHFTPKSAEFFIFKE